MRQATLILVVFALAAVGCSKGEGRSTVRKGADDIASEFENAPETANAAADDVDETARDFVGNGDNREPPDPAAPATSTAPPEPEHPAK